LSTSTAVSDRLTRDYRVGIVTGNFRPAAGDVGNRHAALRSMAVQEVTLRQAKQIRAPDCNVGGINWMDLMWYIIMDFQVATWDSLVRARLDERDILLIHTRSQAITRTADRTALQQTR